MATREAYQKTQAQLKQNPKLQAMFDPVFIERLSHWNQVARSFLRTDPAKIANWTDKICKFLLSSGYEADEVNDYLEAVDTQRAFLKRQSILYALTDRASRQDQ